MALWVLNVSPLLARMLFANRALFISLEAFELSYATTVLTAAAVGVSVSVYRALAGAAVLQFDMNESTNFQEYALICKLVRKQEGTRVLYAGQQQQLAMGQALMAKPQMLILDEQGQGLAPVIAKEVKERFRAPKATGLGLLFVKQAVQASTAMADELPVLEMGQIILAGPATADTREELQEAYFGVVSTA